MDSLSFPSIDGYLKSFDGFSEDSFLFHRFSQIAFTALSDQEKKQTIWSILLGMIQKETPPVFLLSAVLDTIALINQQELFVKPLLFSDFETWLNVESGLSEEDNLQVRAKISGKSLSRSVYQAFFPIGGNKRFEGDHYVVAHLSPDIDTLTASFWGWIDAFAARICTGIHVWHLPGGAPDNPFSTLFSHTMGENILKLLPSTDTALPALDADKKATFSMRDFSNFNEVKMHSSYDLISVIDHHKSVINTPFPATVIIADVQSCNTLVSEEFFKVNDRYSARGMTLEAIDTAIYELSNKEFVDTQDKYAHLQKLLERRQALFACLQNLGFYISPKREFSEYFTCLYAIMDDTDLLAKVSERDVECIASLLNRLQSLASGKDVEIIHFNDLPRNASFAKQAARRILQNHQMYHLYKKIYDLREKDVEGNLKACFEGKPSNLFSDTKIQNGCCRIGQTKLFSSNFSFLSEHSQEIRKRWLQEAQKIYDRDSNVDFHLQMISTISSAEEVYTGYVSSYIHRDELWIWMPPTEKGLAHFTYFFTQFQSVLVSLQDSLTAEIAGSFDPKINTLFQAYFPDAAIGQKSDLAPHLILRFEPGRLNSRKTMITPFLPN